MKKSSLLSRVSCEHYDETTIVAVTVVIMFWVRFLCPIVKYILYIQWSGVYSDVTHYDVAQGRCF